MISTILSYGIPIIAVVIVAYILTITNLIKKIHEILSNVNNFISKTIGKLFSDGDYLFNKDDKNKVMIVGSFCLALIAVVIEFARLKEYIGFTMGDDPITIPVFNISTTHGVLLTLLFIVISTFFGHIGIENVKSENRKSFIYVPMLAILIGLAGAAGWASLEMYYVINPDDQKLVDKIFAFTLSFLCPVVAAITLAPVVVVIVSIGYILSKALETLLAGIIELMKYLDIALAYAATPVIFLFKFIVALGWFKRTTEIFRDIGQELRNREKQFEGEELSENEESSTEEETQGNTANVNGSHNDVSDILKEIDVN